MLPKIKCTFSVLKMETMFNPCLRFREFMHSYDFVTPIAVKTSTYSRSTQEFRYTSYGIGMNMCSKFLVIKLKLKIQIFVQDV